MIQDTRKRVIARYSDYVHCVTNCTPDELADISVLDSSTLRSVPPQAIRHDDPTCLILPPLFASGDYMGSTVELSNYREMKSMFPETTGVYFVRGDYGYSAVAISLTCSDPDVWDLLDSLAHYPVISDDALTNLETELIQEAWNDWGSHDWKLAIERERGKLPEFLTNTDLADLFSTTCENTGKSWTFDTISPYIDMEDLAQSIRPADFMRAIVAAASQSQKEHDTTAIEHNQGNSLDRVQSDTDKCIPANHGE